jgi:predicted neutral ceramidase superfamily lipid hydrolase
LGGHSSDQIRKNDRNGIRQQPAPPGIAGQEHGLRRSGYAITQLATLLAKLFEFSSVSYPEILFITSASLGSCLIFVVIIKIKESMSTKFAHFVYFSQFSIWLILYTLWLLSLRETRVMALFCALMALTFLLANTRLVQSITITVITTVLQIGGSYFAIVYLHQPGSFALEVYYTACFIPSALFICNLSGQYAVSARKSRKQSLRSNAIAMRWWWKWAKSPRSMPSWKRHWPASKSWPSAMN